MVSFFIKNIIYIVLLISSIIISLMSLIWERSDGDYQNGYYYVLFYFILSLVILIYKKKLQNIPWKLNFIKFSLCCLPLFIVEPLFENDHYRYFWEGKTIQHFENPYKSYPKSSKLDYINFTMRDRIGYPYLTTVYPPGAISIFAVFSFGPYWLNKLIFQFINLVLVFLLIRINYFNRNSIYLLLAIPMLLKEFIGAVHIELLALMPIALAIYYFKHFQKTVFICMALKLIGILFWPYFLVHDYFKKNYKNIIFSFMTPLCFVAFYIWASSDSSFNGFTKFQKVWVWNPGLYTILFEYFSWKDLFVRQISQALFISYLAILGFGLIRKKGELKYCLICCGGAVCAMMYFYPVYNGWYGVWPWFFGLVNGIPSMTIYGLTSVLGYMGWGMNRLMPYTAFISHLPFYLLSYKVFKDLYSKNS